MEDENNVKGNIVQFLAAVKLCLFVSEEDGVTYVCVFTWVCLFAKFVRSLANSS